MKEHPIIFSAGMVLAILYSGKSQTRRVILPQPKWIEIPDTGGNGYWGWQPRKGLFYDSMHTYEWPCPYGRVGDKLWVKETLIRGVEKYTENGMTYYTTQHKATCTAVPYAEGAEIGYCGYALWQWPDRNTLPAIFMPKWACRLWLEILDIRVERLQDISEDDKLEEGYWQGGYSTYKGPWLWFKEYWDSLNAKRGYGWDTNPWVWRILYRRIP